MKFIKLTKDNLQLEALIYKKDEILQITGEDKIPWAILSLHKRGIWNIRSFDVDSTLSEKDFNDWELRIE